MTGDLIAHNMWETTKEKNMEQIQRQAELFKKTFGSAKIFSVMGNHETHPSNVSVSFNILLWTNVS
jgi:sphingomyelin phosphodiesterase